MTQQDTRMKLIEAFSRRLAQSSYHGVSLTDVARDTGIRKPSIYHHFEGGKEALFEAASMAFIDRQGAALAAALAAKGALPERLERIAQVVAEQAILNGALEQRLYESVGFVEEDVAARVSAAYLGTLLGPVETLFAAAVDSGELVGDPGLLMNAFLHMARAGELARGPDAGARIVALFLDGARGRG